MSEKVDKGGMWAFLEKTGVLEHGSPEEILEAKRKYWKQYIRDYRRKQRVDKPEFIVWISKKNGDYSTVNSAARRHKLAITAFIRYAALAYIRKTYIVPDKSQMYELRQLLSDTLNEIQSIASRRERYLWGKEQKIKDVERQIEKLETKITNSFEQPITLEELIRREIEKNPLLKEHLIAFLSTNDHQNQIT
jgi:hypothetical protein